MPDYVCKNCGKPFTVRRSDSAARAEARQLFPDRSEDELEVICEDCWQKFSKWWGRAKAEIELTMAPDLSDEFPKVCISTDVADGWLTWMIRLWTSDGYSTLVMSGRIRETDLAHLEGHFQDVNHRWA